MHGSVQPIVGMRKGAGGYVPRRQLGGWLMTYGKVAPDGSVVPTVDRDDQVMEAARELGHIDWQSYLAKGAWNDTHDEGVIVGHPTGLEFHDGSTELSKASRKVGFWTEGHLWDPEDARSWTAFGCSTPSPRELERADHFWHLATMLKGSPRPLGFSAHGLMALSPCGKRIIKCKVTQAAICELPKNPDATIDLVKGSPLELMRKGIVTRSDRPCGRCSCPAGACEGLLKGTSTSTISSIAPQDLEGANTDNAARKMRKLVQAVAARYGIEESDALDWVRRYFLRENQDGRQEQDRA